MFECKVCEEIHAKTFSLSIRLHIISMCNGVYRGPPMVHQKGRSNYKYAQSIDHKQYILGFHATSSTHILLVL